MPSAFGFVVALILFTGGAWIAATKHWLWTLLPCLLPAIVFKIFFLDDILAKVAANEVIPIVDMVWFLTAGAVGTVAGYVVRIVKN